MSLRAANLRSIFVNSYSRPTPLRALVIIASLYGGAASCAFFQVRTLANHFSTDLHPLMFHLCLHEVLNGYHHWLFGCLCPLGVRIYAVPRHGCLGGWPVPHYLGEILSFVGYAMMSDLLPVRGATCWSHRHI